MKAKDRCRGGLILHKPRPLDVLVLADTNARDSAIVFSIAMQHGADPETIRKALCRDSSGRASGPLGAALDKIAGERS